MNVIDVSKVEQLREYIIIPRGISNQLRDCVYQVRRNKFHNRNLKQLF